MTKRKTTKNKSYDFIQLGRKVNGRIKCNEEYNLDEVFDNCRIVVQIINRTKLLKDLSWFDKIFKTKKYYISKAAGDIALVEIENMRRSFKSMITHDLAGLVKKKKAKK